MPARYGGAAAAEGAREGGAAAKQKQASIDAYFCKTAYEASMRCLSANGMDREKCRPEFAAYKECKKAEVKARKDKSFF